MFLSQPLLRVQLGLGLITLCTMLLELCLIRVLDVILNPVIGYMVITTSMFSLGLGGIYVFIFKNRIENQLRLLPLLTLLFAGLILFLLPAFNWLPFNLEFEGPFLSIEILSWCGMYLVLTAPFFISGIIISVVFSNYSSESHRFYFFDLCGAGVGCLLLVPLIPHYGLGGLLFFISGILMMAAVLFSTWSLKWIFAGVPIVLGVMIFPLTLEEYIDFRGHGNKRGVDDLIRMGNREYVKWDPVSKLDVLTTSPIVKNFSLDGGQQGSWLLKTNRNFEAILTEMESRSEDYFFGISSAVHFLKKGKESEVLVIGAAVGGETKTALIFGAKRVDAIDLVAAMVDAAKTRYEEFSGGVFTHPKVNYFVGEGRTYLRSTKKKYDVIQMFSNHTSCSLASGSGVLSSVYLQTAEAYREYFEHLKEDGVLQVNHHLYPKMIITAALGWNQLGKADFHKHVLVFERYIADNLPTLLIKMTPWTEEEIEQLNGYMNREKTGMLKKLPRRAAPSQKIYSQNPYRAEFMSDSDEMEGVSLMIGTHGPERLDSNTILKILDSKGTLVASSVMPGETIRNNAVVDFKFPVIRECRNKQFLLEVSSDNPDPQKGFSVWLTTSRSPVMSVLPRTPMPAYTIVFHPLNPDQNLIPKDFLQHPFPEELAAQADYKMNPQTDNKPHFNMIRKSNYRLDSENSICLDGGTAYFLNNQLRRFLPYNWISIFIVGAISILFSIFFIVIPFKFTSLGITRWNQKTAYLIYFSCLGAGFIILELTFIQIFTKVIGFPTHTFATVIFTILFAAGIGSMVSKKRSLYAGGRWKTICAGILIYGLFFLGVYPTLFSWILKYSLSIRILMAVALIFPLGFFLGMPFPLGIMNLGKIEPKGIPWAWGLNGFFTVFGGYLGLLISIWVGFQAVIAFGLGIYLAVFLVFSFICRERSTLTTV